MTTDLVTVDPGDVLLPVDANTARQAMTAYQQVTAAVLETDDWQGPPHRKGSFVKKSGWRKIAKAYRLSTELISHAVDRDPEGHPVRAEAVVRALAPNGQHMDGTGFCDVTEPRFRSSTGRHKLENDLRTTAETRAKNRAISDLTGFGQVSAEEADVTSHELEYGPAATVRQAELMHRAVEALYGEEDIDAGLLARLVARLEQDAGGYLPKVAARAIMLVAAHRPGHNHDRGGATGTSVADPAEDPATTGQTTTQEEGDQKQEPTA